MIDQNELSRKAMGGTELQAKWMMDHVSLDLLEKFQIVPSRVRDLDPNKKKVLWLHDLAQDPEADHLKDAESRDRFDGIVFVSNWQLEKFNLFLGFPYNKGVVIQNAIVPIPDHTKANDGTIRLIYHTTPHRGLGILVPVFNHLWESFKKDGINIQLDVYSSFSLYGWSERDKPYQPLFQQCIEHPAINYHGAVSNDKIREALQKSDIFAYPCIWQETSCIAAIEALSAKNIVVAPNFGALPETCANFAMSYQFSENSNEHANRFAVTLAQAVYAVKGIKDGTGSNMENLLDLQKVYIDSFYNWETRGIQWTNYLQSLLQ